MRERQIESMTSQRKAEKFAEVAQEHGWETEVTERPDLGDDYWETNCNRAGEHIHIFYTNNQLTETPKYTFLGRTLSLHNTATATRKLATEPDLTKTYKRVAPKRSARLQAPMLDETPLEEEDPTVLFARRDLPFDIVESSDAEILKAVRGSTLIYWNSLAKRVEREFVPYIVGKDRNVQIFNVDLEDTFYQAETDEGKAYLSFMNINGEYRAVHLENILEVR